MADLKTGDVGDFLAQLDSAKRADSAALIELMGDVTGEPPVLWGTMVGFGRYHYRYESGHEGDAFLLGFAPRKAEFSVYLMGLEDGEARQALLASLGKHRMGKGCLYVKRLSDIDIGVLRDLALASVAALRSAIRLPEKKKAATTSLSLQPWEYLPTALLRAWGTSGRR